VGIACFPPYQLGGGGGRLVVAPPPRPPRHPLWLSNILFVLPVGFAETRHPFYAHLATVAMLLATPTTPWLQADRPLGGKCERWDRV